MKHFFRHWQYGIKARVIDDALLAHIDTAIEPVFIRFDLARLQQIIIDVTNKGGDHELVLAGVGAPAATTVLARFDVRAAADEAAACLRCALMRGNRRCRFWPALKITLGIVFGLATGGLLLTALGLGYSGTETHGTSPETLLQSLENRATTAAPDEPQSAEQFLNSRD